jgi:hypothetical protein
VAVLAVLNYKKHEDRNNRGESVDDELPRVVEMKKRAQQAPGQYNKKCKKARKRLRGFIGNPFCDHREIFHVLLQLNFSKETLFISANSTRPNLKQSWRLSPAYACGAIGGVNGRRM